MTFGSYFSLTLWVNINSVTNYGRYFELGNGAYNLNVLACFPGGVNGVYFEYFD